MRKALLQRLFPLLVIVLASLILTNCGLGESIPLASPTQISSATFVPPTETPFPSPTPTPTSLPPLVVLLAPQGSDPVLVSELQTLLQELSDQADSRFQLRPSLSSVELAMTRVVVALPPASGMQELLDTPADTQFLLVGIPSIDPGERVSSIRTSAGNMDRVGFLAGYLAAVISQDWRAGVISESGTASGNALRLGFINGATYFCGLCRPVYPPFPPAGYPLSIDLPSGAGAVDWQATANHFVSWGIQTVFVDPVLADEQAIRTLAAAGMDIIMFGPPPESLRDNWVASIDYQSPIEAVKTLWTLLLDGKGGQTVDLPIELVAANPEKLSPGRQRLVEKMWSELIAGQIDTGVDPSTGEAVQR